VHLPKNEDSMILKQEPWTFSQQNLQHQGTKAAEPLIARLDRRADHQMCKSVNLLTMVIYRDDKKLEYDKKCTYTTSLY